MSLDKKEWDRLINNNLTDEERKRSNEHKLLTVFYEWQKHQTLSKIEDSDFIIESFLDEQYKKASK